MSIELKCPLIFFDLESTGLNVLQDKIIQIGMIKVNPDQTRETLEYFVNPQIQVRKEILTLTGIKQEDLDTAKTFKELGQEVKEFCINCDFAGYNLKRFDIPLLLEEFKRNRISFDLESTVGIIDIQTIFHKKEPRNLSAAYKFYCKQEMKNAHSALADTQATLDIFLAQLEYYSDLPKSISDLTKFCTDERFVDRQGRLHWEDNEAVIGFGKHKGVSLKNMVEKSPGYLKWIIDNDFPEDTKEILKMALSGLYPSKK